MIWNAEYTRMQRVNEMKFFRFFSAAHAFLRAYMGRAGNYWVDGL